MIFFYCTSNCAVRRITCLVKKNQHLPLPYLLSVLVVSQDCSEIVFCCLYFISYRYSCFGWVLLLTPFESLYYCIYLVLILILLTFRIPGIVKYFSNLRDVFQTQLICEKFSHLFFESSFIIFGFFRSLLKPFFELSTASERSSFTSIFYCDIKC